MSFDPFEAALRAAELKRVRAQYDAGTLPAVPRTTRAHMLQMALLMQDDTQFEAAMAGCEGDHTGQRLILTLRGWAFWGAQSVTMPATFAAALCATDCKGAIEPRDPSEQLPWPCFEIQVPQGLLWSSHGAVSSIFVLSIPKELMRTGPYRHHNLSVAYCDEQSTGCNTYEHLADMLGSDRFIMDSNDHGQMPDGLRGDYDVSLEERLWALISRLIGGVTLSIAEARREHPGAFRAPSGGVKQKKGKVKANTFTLGKPMKLDCRPALHDYLEGRRGGGGAPSVSTIVRGHWRQQPFGPGKQQRRAQWIKPFVRGEGPLVMRPVRIGDDGVLPGTPEG